MSDVCRAWGNNVYGNKISCPVCGVSLSTNRVSSRQESTNRSSSSGYQPRTSYSQGSSRQKTTNSSSAQEGSGFGYGILGFFVWPVGLILYFALRESKPKASNGSLVGAVIAIVLAIMVSI